MKRTKTVIAFLLFFILILGIFYFSGVELNPTDNNEGDKRFRVGLIMHGSRDDRGWSESHYDSIIKVSAEEDFLLELYENVPVNRYCKDKISSLINDGCKLIILDYEGYEQYARELAIDHPEVEFLNANAEGYGSNYCSFMGRMYQARYLLGILAGLQTETNEIMYTAPFDNSRVIRGIDAFTIGVRKVNPDATVYVRYTGSWDDDKKAAEAAEKLINDHNADIMVCHLNSKKPLEIANWRGIWTIGYHMNNEQFYRDTYLSAAIWDWDDFYREHIKDSKYNRFTGENHFLGIDQGIVDISPLTHLVNPEIRDIVMAEREKLINREYDVFYGPVYDRDGNLIIPASESATDNVLKKTIDWYVPGVVIDE